MTKNALEIYVDGASSGNPGPAGIGVVIFKDGKIIKDLSKYIGEVTNNFSEYMALIYGLQEALILGAREVTINTDSQLLAKQIEGRYKVRDTFLKMLCDQAQHLISGFKSIRVRKIDRKKNRVADRLANEAIKKAGLR